MTTDPDPQWSLPPGMPRAEFDQFTRALRFIWLYHTKRGVQGATWIDQGDDNAFMFTRNPRIIREVRKLVNRICTEEGIGPLTKPDEPAGGA